MFNRNESIPVFIDEVLGAESRGDGALVGDSPHYRCTVYFPEGTQDQIDCYPADGRWWEPLPTRPQPALTWAKAERTNGQILYFFKEGPDFKRCPNPPGGAS